MFCAPMPRIQPPNPAQIRTYPGFLQLEWYFSMQTQCNSNFEVGGQVARPAIGVWQSAIVPWRGTNGVWHRSLGKCSAQGAISARGLLTFSNLFAIPPVPVVFPHAIRVGAPITSPVLCHRTQFGAELGCNTQLGGKLDPGILFVSCSPI